jgi:hypothetical protein
MAVLFGLIAQRRTAIYEETMIAVAAVVQAIGEDFAVFVDRVMEIVGEMIGTGNPAIIGASADILGDLFRTMPARMEAVSDAVFGRMLGIVEDPIVAEAYELRVIACLSDVMLAVPVLGQHRDNFFALLLRALGQAKIDINSMEGMNNASELFKVLFGGFRVLVETSQDPGFVAEHRTELMRPILMFIDSGAFCQKTFLPLFRYLREIAKLADSRTRIQLNRQKIRAVLANAAESQVNLVSHEAEDLLTYLRYAK